MAKRTKRDWYRLYRNGVLSDAPAEQRTESEAAEQNEAMAEAGLTSRWVKWDMEAGTATVTSEVAGS